MCGSGGGGGNLMDKFKTNPAYQQSRAEAADRLANAGKPGYAPLPSASRTKRSSMYIRGSRIINGYSPTNVPGMTK